MIALCAALAIGGVALAVSVSAWWLALLAVIAIPALGSRALQHRTRLAPERTRRATINYVVAFLFYAYAAVLVQAAISGPHHLLAVAGAATVAWGVGLVAVFAPGGIGVREAVYTALLAGLLPAGEPAAGAVTMRLVMVAAELGVLLVAGRPKLDREAARQRWHQLGANLRPDLLFVRRHAFFGVLLGVGTACARSTMLAYQPALVFWDSAGYIATGAPPDAVRDAPVRLPAVPQRPADPRLAGDRAADPAPDGPRHGADDLPAAPAPERPALARRARRGAGPARRLPDSSSSSTSCPRRCSTSCC